MVEDEKSPPVAIKEGAATAAEIAEIEEGKYYTVKQLAQKTGYTTTWISMLCKAGRIHAIKPTGGQWRIPASEFNRVIKEGIPPLPREKPAAPITRIRVPVEKQKEIAPSPVKKEEERNSYWPLPFPLRK